MKLIKGKLAKAQKIVIYGPEGIGKSTFAAQFPEPLFIDVEGSTAQLDVTRTQQTPTSYALLTDQINYVIDHPEICKTLVIDTIDWAENLCKDYVVAQAKNSKIQSISDFGYGAGYAKLEEEWGKFLNRLTELIKRGVHVVLVAHAQMRKFERPDEMGAYDRFELKLEKKVSALTKEWADMLLFANYKIMVINVDNQGAAKGKNKATGGQRVMYTNHHPAWDAKNRHGLPEELPFDYKAIKEVIEGAMPDPVYYNPATDTLSENKEAGNLEVPGEALEAAQEIKAAEANKTAREELDPPMTDDKPEDPLKGVPGALKDLMEANGVSLEEITRAVEAKGYYPAGTPFESYNDDFIQGVLIGAWEQVLNLIKQSKGE